MQEDAGMNVQQYRAMVIEVGRGRVFVPVPFDPDLAFGSKVRHHVTGTVNGMGVRAVIEAIEGGYGFVLGPAWRRDFGVSPGDVVEVSLSPEGPQRGDLPADLVAALENNPAAGEFFDSLAQFYRKGYLGWIEATRRSPQLRPERIAETVRLLAEGHKSRPTP
jgi:hypothetical protein